MISLPKPLCWLQWLVLFVLTTVPLVFGAIHPIVQAFYVGIVLVGVGGLLLFVPLDLSLGAGHRYWLLPVFLLLVFTSLQALPLPLAWMEVFSPARAARVAAVNTLAQGGQHFTALSDQQLLSLQQTILFLALLIFFFALKGLLRADHRFLKTLVFSLTLLGVFEALYGLLQFLNPRTGILWLPPPSSAAATGTIIYKNQYASLLNMCWPLSLAAAVSYLHKFQAHGRTKSLLQRFRQRIGDLSDIKKEVPLFFLAVGIMLLAVLFSLSRGGIIAMVIILLLLSLYLPLAKKTKILTIGFLLFFLFSYGMILGLDTVSNRFNSIGESGGTRWEIYVASLPMLFDHWLTGIGLGSYTLLSPVYLKGFPAAVHFNQVHNEYLELAIELGLPAAILLFGWLGIALCLAGKKLAVQAGESPTARRFSVYIGGAAFCGLVGFFVHGLADFGWRLPANLFLAVTLAAMVSFALENTKMSKGVRP